MKQTLWDTSQLRASKQHHHSSSPTPRLHLDPGLPRRVELIPLHQRVRHDELRLLDPPRQLELTKHRDERAVERVGEQAFYVARENRSATEAMKARKSDLRCFSRWKRPSSW